tara:strand:+ start:3627 stop:4901 length:1275 start_codon:yes stop_codon:yes gene_type:complete
MKLLFESWRRFLQESSDPKLKSIESYLKEQLPKGQWSVLENLGRGAGGEVFLIESYVTGERRALKIVTPSSNFYETEAKNYKWMLDNRDSLPECERSEKGKKLNDGCDDVRKYFPKVFSVMRTDKGVDLIQMEVLESLPEGLADDLFVYAGGKITPRKVEVLLSDLPLVMNLLKSLASVGMSQFALAARIPRRYLLDLEGKNLYDYASDITDRAMVEWKKFYQESGQNTPKNKEELDLTYTKGPGGENLASYDIIPNWTEDPYEKFKSIIADALIGEIKNIYKGLDRSTQTSADGITKYELADLRKRYNDIVYFGNRKMLLAMDEFMKKSPIPLGRDDTWDDSRSHGANVAELFPEARGLNRATQILRDKYGFIAQDMHRNNIMTRPGTNDLVVVDLGAFTFTRKGSSTNPLSGPTQLHPNTKE